MSKKGRPVPRNPAGFVDAAAADLEARATMVDTLRGVYRHFGFEALETPGIEYLDTLGKYLPESDEPSGGVFAMRDDDEQWISLRYDLTAPLSRYVAQNRQQLPRPARFFQAGPVWRREKPGPGRFRQFTQCDFDTVGTPSMAADAEVCAVLSAGLEAVGISRGDYIVRVNDRKVLNGVLESIGVPAGDGRWLTVLRAIDKLDRLGPSGVRELLGKGREDESGDYTKGAELEPGAIERVMAFVGSGLDEAGKSLPRGQVCERLAATVGDSDIGKEGVEELRTIDALLTAMDLAEDRVIFDPSVVRGLGYYTGPVFEAELTFEIKDEKGRPRTFGSVSGGGRYDDLVERFTGEKVPAVGASIGVDRLLSALRMLKPSAPAPGPVVVTVMDKSRLVDYQAMVGELRAAGVRAEMYLGGSGFRAQMKYADRRRAPAAIIAGGDEFDRGEVSIKDMGLGAELAGQISDRDEWRKGQPAQFSVSRGDMVSAVQRILAGESPASDGADGAAGGEGA